MAEKDPFTKTATCFWTVLEADTDFASAVKSGNRIKWSENRYEPDEHHFGPDDLPSVWVMYHGLRPTVAAGMLKNTSSTNLLDSIWSIETKTRPYRDDERASLDWIILRAMMNFDDSLQALTWDSSTFATCSRFPSAESNVEQYKANHGITGWHTAMQVIVHMKFGRTAITP